MPRSEPRYIRALAALPAEFTHTEFAQAYNANSSTASGMLYRLQRSGIIEKIAWGHYRKLPCGANGADSATTREQASAKILGHCLDPILPDDHPSKLHTDLSAVSSLFDDIAAILAENERLRTENAKLREESTWLTTEINRWAGIARAAKQIPLARGGEH